MALDYRRHRFTVRDYEEMSRAGILDDDARVELLDGEIVEMAPIGDRHYLTTVRVDRAFQRAYWEAGLVAVQSPVRLGEQSEPEPDVAVLRSGIRGVPSAEDVLLLVEVADTTVEADRRIKLPLYAAAGVRETWLVDLTRDVVEIYREPMPKGYRSIRIAWAGESIAPEALPDRPVAVADLLPPSEEEGPGDRRCP